MNIPDLEERCFCGTCRNNESMDHILMTCEHPARKLIWEMAKDLWPHDKNTWPGISFRTIIGCNTLNVDTLQGKKDDSGQTQANNMTRALHAY